MVHGYMVHTTYTYRNLKCWKCSHLNIRYEERCNKITDTQLGHWLLVTEHKSINKFWIQFIAYYIESNCIFVAMENFVDTDRCASYEMHARFLWRIYICLNCLRTIGIYDIWNGNPLINACIENTHTSNSIWYINDIIYDHIRCVHGSNSYMYFINTNYYNSSMVHVGTTSHCFIAN